MVLDNVQFSCQYVFLNSLLKYYIIIPNIIANPKEEFQAKRLLNAGEYNNFLK